MATDYSPYEGMAVTGWPDTVVANGRVVIECGELGADPGTVGTFPACGATLGDGLLSQCRRPTKATAYGPPAGRGRPVQIHRQRVNLVFVSTLRRRVSALRWGCEQAAIERDRAETRDGNWVGHDGKSAGAQA